MGTQSAPDAIAGQHGWGLQAVATRGFMALYPSGCLLAAANGVETAATIIPRSAVRSNIVSSTSRDRGL